MKMKNETRHYQNGSRTTFVRRAGTVALAGCLAAAITVAPAFAVSASSESAEQTGAVPSVTFRGGEKMPQGEHGDGLMPATVEAEGVLDVGGDSVRTLGYPRALSMDGDIQPDGAQPPALPDGAQPPALPDGAQPDGAQPDGAQPPALPDGAQPPALPDGDSPSRETVIPIDRAASFMARQADGSHRLGFGQPLEWRTDFNAVGESLDIDSGTGDVATSDQGSASDDIGVQTSDARYAEDRGPLGDIEGLFHQFLVAIGLGR